MDRMFLALALALVMSACAYNEHNAKAEASFHEAQTERKPLFELVGIEGQAIELKGVSRLTVNDPRANEVKQYVKPAGRGWSTLDRVLGLVGQGLDKYGTAKLVLGVADAMGENAGDRSTHSFVDNSDHSTHDDSTHVADSYNDSSDNSTTGDTISDSGNTPTMIEISGDGSIVGDGNDVTNGDNNGNNGEIRVESPGPYDDHGNPGDCDGAGDCTLPESDDP